MSTVPKATRRIGLAARRGDTWRYLAAALAGPDGESLLIPLLVGINLIVTRFLVGSATLDGVSVHLIDGAGAIAGVAVFTVGRAVRRRFVEVSVRSNLVLWTIGGFANVMGGALPGWVVNRALGPEQAEQFPAGLVAYSLLFWLVGSYVSLWRSAWPMLQLLTERRLELEQLQAGLADEFAHIRGEMKRAIDGQLRDVIARTSDLLVNSDASARAAAAAQLRLAIDEVVRPLSWTLHESTEPQARPTTGPKPRPGATSDRERLRLLRRAPVELGRIASPVVYLLLALVFVAPAGFFIDGVSGLAVALAGIAAGAVALALVRRGLAAVTVAPLIGVVVVAVVPMLVGTLVSVIAVASGVPLASLVGTATGYGLSAAGAAAFLRLTTQRIDQIREFSDLNDGVDRLNDELSQRVWVARTALARTVHGTVQAKLLVAALRLDSSDGDVDAARADIQSALDAVDQGDEPERTSFAESLDALIGAWRGACDVRATVSPRVVRRIDADPVARACAVEVVREAVANAAKHARSPWAEVEIRLSTEPGTSDAPRGRQSLTGRDESLEIIVRSPGALSAAEPVLRRGLGSTILGTSTAGWQLVQRGECTELQAVIRVASSRD